MRYIAERQSAIDRAARGERDEHAFGPIGIAARRLRAPVDIVDPRIEIGDAIGEIIVRGGRRRLRRGEHERLG